MEEEKNASRHNSKSLFCFGLGYTASALANALVAESWTVAGTSREPEHNLVPARSGVSVSLFDGDHPLADAAAALSDATHLLSSVPPAVDGDVVLLQHAADIAAAGLEWVGYLSTTGVYGDRAGDWVDEESELAPTSARAERRAAAERGWLDLWREHEVPVHIFRLAGIYGPGRSVLDDLRAGTARHIDKPGQIFSRVHVADIVQGLRASMARPNPGAIYNLCDDCPASPGEVVVYGAKILEMAPPMPVPFAEADLSPMALSFYGDNKRVRNARMKAELGVRLIYPDFRAGLRALAEADKKEA